MRLKIYRLIWFLQKNNLKGGINVLIIHPFGLTIGGGNLAELDKAIKESLVVAVCNRAIYEPTLKMK